MNATYETLGLERIDDDLLLIRLNRPQAANAMNTRMGEELLDLFERFQLETDGVRAIVVTGTGEKAFCAGGDLKERNGMTDAQWLRQHAMFERMLRAVVACPLPLIGAVNGAAFGGGCELAAALDFTYAAESARFALTEVTLGIMPGAGGTQNLPRALGERRAKEIILTGLPFTAQEACDWGFVNRVLPQADLLEATLATARRIAGNAPIAVRQAKQSIHRGLQMSLADGLAFEIECYNRMVATQDRHEGVRAFNEKRKPRFRGE
ncbi:enoyl-CoA hydratase/isomerase family protein [Methylobacterium frigidaeris]|uniref:Enoyl-CoA hydratase echA8 n=1 Tax=Methylobacterium frigidaeris TaxID=2038277 RepID=A0AA37M8T7_9HYPH|nr:enoyl-CoA hydratase-related protein [Methylobacterium frigidaeris]PIK73351.1 enoyl-CoA hydratase [Methylobacterium frigidaeris]GJD66532.1 putative enoyl-CoA hydratase echA8 [Methylobacterium frigidaeris]